MYIMNIILRNTLQQGNMGQRFLVFLIHLVTFHLVTFNFCKQWGFVFAFYL